MKSSTSDEVIDDPLTTTVVGVAEAIVRSLDGSSSGMLQVLESMASGVDSGFESGLALARRIDSLDMDAEACLVAFLYAQAQPGFDPTLIAQAVDRPGLIRLYRSVVRMDAISRVAPRHQGDSTQRAESLRRMLIGMVDDVRVVVIRLAAQLEYLHAIKSEQADIQLDVARETLDLFAPLANRPQSGEKT